MSLTFIDTNKIARKVSSEGVAFSEILNEQLCGAKNVIGSLRWVDAGRSFNILASAKHQLVYLMQGSGVIRLNGRDYDVQKGAGVYLEPGESAEIRAGREALKLFHLEVPRIPANWSSKPAG
jgi:quercetin dioxygenase-like cupin family protein